MDGGGGSSSSRTVDDDFTRILLSWSLEDIYNDNLLKNQVEKIPDTDSVGHYLGYFFYPLLEDTRAAMCSSMEEIDKLPYAEITELYLSNPKGEDLYDVKVEHWMNRFSDCGKELYSTLPGDLMILVDAKPGIVSDLRRARCKGHLHLLLRLKRVKMEAET